jgi:hypothetical protein
MHPQATLGLISTKDGTIGQSPHRHGHGLQKPSSDARYRAMWLRLFFRSPHVETVLEYTQLTQNKRMRDRPNNASEIGVR